MKKFKTITYEGLLNAAWDSYVRIATREQELADKGSPLAKERAKIAWAREREVHDELVRVEKRNCKGGKK